MGFVCVPIHVDFFMFAEGSFPLYDQKFVSVGSLFNSNDFLIPYTFFLQCWAILSSGESVTGGCGGVTFAPWTLFLSSHLVSLACLLKQR